MRSETSQEGRVFPVPEAFPGFVYVCGFAVPVPGFEIGGAAEVHGETDEGGERERCRERDAFPVPSLELDLEEGDEQENK